MNDQSNEHNAWQQCLPVRTFDASFSTRLNNDSVTPHVVTVHYKTDVDTTAEQLVAGLIRGRVITLQNQLRRMGKNDETLFTKACEQVNDSTYPLVAQPRQRGPAKPSADLLDKFIGRAFEQHAKGIPQNADEWEPYPDARAALEKAGIKFV